MAAAQGPTARNTAMRAVAALVVGGGIGVLLALGSVGDDQPSSQSTERPGSVEATQPRFAPGGVDGGYVAPRIGTIGGSDCPVFPADNVWHSVIDGPEVPTIDDDDPRSLMLAAASGPARAPFRSDNGEGLNVVPTDTSEVRSYSVASNWLSASNRGDARSSDANRATMGPASAPQLWADLESPGPGELRWTNMSLDPITDNRLYLVDTDECMASEFIGFSGLAFRAGSALVANRMSQFDLLHNNRRASRVWGEGPCPTIPSNPWFEPGCDGTVVKPSAARGGSGLSGVGGLVRAEEIDGPVGIDHAIAVVLPANLIAKSDPVWPATASDGLGSAQTFPDAPDGAEPIPMGSRLRLRADYQLECNPQDCPQATEVVLAMKRHGVIVVDSMGPVEVLSEAAMHISGEMSAEWDVDDLRRIELGGEGSDGMKLSDFELVDAEDMRALPLIGPQDDGWLQVR